MDNDQRWECPVCGTANPADNVLCSLCSRNRAVQRDVVKPPKLRWWQVWWARRQYKEDMYRLGYANRPKKSGG